MPARPVVFPASLLPLLPQVQLRAPGRHFLPPRSGNLWSPPRPAGSPRDGTCRSSHCRTWLSAQLPWQLLPPLSPRPPRVLPAPPCIPPRERRSSPPPPGRHCCPSAFFPDGAAVLPGAPSRGRYCRTVFYTARPPGTSPASRSRPGTGRPCPGIRHNHSTCNSDGHGTPPTGTSGKSGPPSFRTRVPAGAPCS